MNDKDGGNAFPVGSYDHMTFEPQTVKEAKRILSGMSLRDYFAAQFASAQATATSADRDLIRPDFIYPNPGEDGRQTVAKRIARVAYELADAMLAERAK